MFLKSGLGLLTSASIAAAGLIDHELLARQSYGSGSALPISSCPGYIASNAQTTGNGLTADLNLAGPACNTYGYDLNNLRLLVEYQTDTRLHVKIYDAAEEVYQVPGFVVPRPSNGNGTSSSSDISFEWSNSPSFSFAVTRKSNGETLFNTSGSPLTFQSQYLNLRTQLPQSPHLYGLGESSDPFMLNTTNYTRTMWNRDAYGVPTGSNLYGSHPIYFEHRGSAGTHGVFLLNSDGMDIKINNTAQTGQYLEYNILGGVFDFYFLAGPSPRDVSMQYAQTVGTPALMPYWGLGFHQCKYGYQDVYEVAGVVANYSAANIPLETMWTDIDYMDLRKVFTLDPLRFPLPLVQQMVATLHARQQHYVVMVDPATAYQNYSAFNNGVAYNAFMKNPDGTLFQGVVWPGITAFPDWFAPGTQPFWNLEFDTFFNPSTGVDIDALWIDMNEPSNFCVYPCSNPAAFAVQNGDPPTPPAVRPASPTAIPGFPADFQPQCYATVTFNVNATTYFGENILLIGDALGLGYDDIANGAAPMSPTGYPIWNVTVQLPVNSVVSYSYVRRESNGSYILETTNRTVNTGTCNGVVQTVNDVISTAQGTPPSSLATRDVEGPTPVMGSGLFSRQVAAPGAMIGLPGRDLLNPPYHIHNTAGVNISDNTANTNIIVYGGYAEYDTHNLYGAMMSTTSRNSMLSRRPDQRPLVITRSTFAGSGRDVGHWLGDYFSDWFHYRISVAQIVEFAALFQLPMVGADVCGYANPTTELLCARWAMLGAFSPFYRNHHDTSTPQEFYRWPLVAEAARVAIDARYRMLDYLYTAMWNQNQTGTPTLNPLWFVYPNDPNTFPIGLQFFFGDSVLVSPVTEENATSVTIYMPNDQFYDFFTYQPIRGNGSFVFLPSVNFTQIPLYIKGGAILPLRAHSANTTTELRQQNFDIVIAPGLDGNAYGSLYLDQGDDLIQPSYANISFAYENGRFEMGGHFGYNPGVVIETITLLGAHQHRGLHGSQAIDVHTQEFDGEKKTMRYGVKAPMHKGFALHI